MHTIRNSSLGPFLALGGAALLVAALVAALALMTAAPAAGTPATTPSQDWCAEARLGNRGHCELRSFTMGGATSFAVQGMSNGSIQVERWEGDGIRVTARVVARNTRNTAAAEELVRQVELERSGGNLRVSGPRSGFFQRGSWSVDLQLQVPAGTPLELATTNGNVSVAGTLGPVRARSTNGNVSVDEATAPLEARSTNGSLRVTLARLGGSGTVSLQTTNGSVDLTLPAGASATLEASTTNGRISSDFPLQFEGTRQNRARGTVGAGESHVTVRTTNGAVRIHRDGPSS